MIILVSLSAKALYGFLPVKPCCLGTTPNSLTCFVRLLYHLMPIESRKMNVFRQTGRPLCCNWENTCCCSANYGNCLYCVVEFRRVGET